MGSEIRVLPDHLVAGLAAGEVVERPASVVRELVENALDAGATQVVVSLKNGGKTEIRVSDDGHGLRFDEVQLALEPYATSKLAADPDLGGVRTFGFRGVALPAIAAVSRLCIETARREGDGTRLVANGGILETAESCERHVGTTVSARSLFFNRPDRARALGSVAQETRAVLQAVTSLAVAAPHVGFVLRSGGRELLRTPGAPELRTRIADLWGEPFAAGLLPAVYRVQRSAVTGLLEHPGMPGTGSRRRFIIVNGRPIVDRRLERIAARAFPGGPAASSRPSFFLFLDLPDEDVDLNVHPGKTEVRFREVQSVEALVGEAVRAALAAAGVGADAVPDSPAEPDAPRPRSSPVARGGWKAAPVQESTPQMSLFVAGAESAVDPDGLGEPDPERTSVVSARPAMWQVHGSYILAETRSGVIIVDQHSAHERILFEETLRGVGASGAAPQRLLFPVTMRLSAAEFARVEELCALLAQIGFELELIGGRTLVMHAAPQPHPRFDPERCLREMIAELTSGSELIDSARSQHQRVALSYACKAAIRPGEPLSPAEMTELFDRLFATERPYEDIHGRPTVVQLSMQELRQKFGR